MKMIYVYAGLVLGVYLAANNPEVAAQIWSSAEGIWHYVTAALTGAQNA
ncbi:hypothetical protein [Ferrimonas kyonanensis]|nr:hypothetical protein [Ferrimonas kyonanensis]